MDRKHILIDTPILNVDDNLLKRVLKPDVLSIKVPAAVQ
jgi:hypothetical protein